MDAQKEEERQALSATSKKKEYLQFNEVALFDTSDIPNLYFGL